MTFFGSTRLTQVLAILAFLFPIVMIVLCATEPSLKPSEKDGECVEWRPLPWVYATVWSLLPLLAAVAWFRLVIQQADLATGGKLIFSALLTAVFALSPIWCWFYHDKHRINSREDAVNVLYSIGALSFAGLTASLWARQGLLIVVFLSMMAWVGVQLGVSVQELSCSVI